MKREPRPAHRTHVANVDQARIPPTRSPDDARATDGWDDDGGKTPGAQPVATAKPPSHPPGCSHAASEAASAFHGLVVRGRPPRRSNCPVSERADRPSEWTVAHEPESP